MLAIPVGANPDRPEHRRGAHLALAPHLLVLRIEHEVGIRLAAEIARAPRRDFGVELLHDRTHRRGRHGHAAERLHDACDFARGDPLHVHLDQRGEEGLLAAFIAGKERGLKEAGPIARHAELE